MHKPRVVALWGAHRLPPTHDDPSSHYKGVPELAELGHEIMSIYPQEERNSMPRLLRGLLQQRAMYKTIAPSLLWRLKPSDVLYTAENSWCHLISRLKGVGLLKQRLIFKWAGFDADWSKILGQPDSPEHRYFRELLLHTDVVFFASARQLQLVSRAYQDQANKLCFWPTAIDTDFYAAALRRNCIAKPYFVAVGNDSKRDWALIVELARRGIPMKIVSDDQRVRALLEQLGDSRPELLDVEYRVGYKRSAEIMAEAAGVVLATLPNERFSGSTTVSVAACLGKPLILDDEYDLPAYGLIPGVNCEWFHRGSIDSAFNAIQAVRMDTAHARRLGENISSLSPGFSTRAAAATMAAAFAPEWRPTPFVPAQVALLD